MPRLGIPSSNHSRTTVTIRSTIRRAFLAGSGDRRTGDGRRGRGTQRRPDTRRGGDGAGAVDANVSSSSGEEGSLPFTGAQLGLLLAAGLALLAGGGAARRRLGGPAPLIRKRRL